MDLQRAKLAFIKARERHAESMEDIENLPRNVDDKTFMQVFRAERDAWKHFATTRQALKDAKLQSIGR